MAQKNKYIREAKVSERTTEILFDLYFSEVTRKYSRKKCTRRLGGFGEDHGLSEQTLYRYFGLFSAYIWENFIIPNEPTFNDGKVFVELKEVIEGKRNSLSKSYRDTYEYLKLPPFYLNDGEPVERALPFHYLKQRSRACRGISEKTFPYEFSRIYFICLVVEGNIREHDAELRYASLSDVFEPDLAARIAIEATKTFGHYLQTKPLDDH